LTPHLYTFDEITRLSDTAVVDGLSHDGAELLQTIANWSRDYLTNPHPALGRSGDVCPWVQASIQTGRFYLSMIARPQDDIAAAERAMLSLRDRFLAMEPTCGRAAQLKTIVVVFSELPEPLMHDLVVDLHTRLKPTFVDHALMLGEFFPTCDKPGLHNPGFRPLRSPAPLVVIRSMVPNDIAFLYDRKLFVQMYLRNFRAAGIDGICTYLERNRQKLTADQISTMLDVLMDAGVPMNRPWRATDPTTGALTTECLLRHFDARLSGMQTSRSLAWIAFRIERTPEIRQAFGEGAVRSVLMHVCRLADEVVRTEKQLAYDGEEWFSIALWNVSDSDAAAIAQHLQEEVESGRFRYGSTTLTLALSIGVASVGNCDREEGKKVTAVALLRDAQSRATAARPAATG